MKKSLELELPGNEASDEEMNRMKQNRRILLVDDEPYNLLGLSIIIQQCGFPGIKHLIYTANNGQQALNMVKQAYNDRHYSYGLIFMDCSMPVMDGYEATDCIRSFIKLKNMFQPMIIACTGHTEEEYIKKAWRH